ncbi:PIN domain-containing protein [uncultured Thiocystis sp.]|uniref:PIN domain-containing protein n=1 Tax=uncultured Thiocystis sp. TaxID=1202134 RepID=UPI0025FB1A07|nr:PIN domain-containing protein [uncultured Thiocystis sp.]
MSSPENFRRDVLATIDIDETESLLEQAKKLVKLGIKAKDALHVASAIEGKAKYFVTTDDKLIKKMIDLIEITAINPIALAGIIDERND